MRSNIKTRKTKKQVRKQKTQRGGAAGAAGSAGAVGAAGVDGNNNNEPFDLSNVFKQIDAQAREAQTTAALLAAAPSAPTETPIVFPSVKDLPPVPIAILVSLERITDLQNCFKEVPSIEKILKIYTHLHNKLITEPKSIIAKLSIVNEKLIYFYNLLVKKKVDNGWRQYIKNIIEDNSTNIERIKIAYKL
jgi:hypothetical protein